MLFNSLEFVFIFLPIALLFYYAIFFTFNGKFEIEYLICTSLLFYSWWIPKYIFIIISSIIANYIFGTIIIGKKDDFSRKIVLISGISLNIALLCIFKYTNFIIFNINLLFDIKIENLNIELPLAISFFTFQQIAYLVDVYYGKSEERSFRKFALFILFFPQLIAGPIVHHNEIIPQFKKDRFRNIFRNLSVGVTLISIGLFKKVILSDGIAQYSDPFYNAVEHGFSPSLVDSWGATLAFSFQIYFDFSGYSDIALGLAAIFGIGLPINFFSPYKAPDIITFWRCWHMTLSRFLRDYLYIPLGGRRKGPARFYGNLMMTMLVAGLWHGAGWNFIVWGGIHGAYLSLNHAWRAVAQRAGIGPLPRPLAVLVTFAAVVAAWAFFRAESWFGARQVFMAMVGYNGVVLPISYLPLLNKIGGLGDWMASFGVTFQYMRHFQGVQQIIDLAALLAITWLFPNSIELLGRYRLLTAVEAPAVQPTSSALKWRPTSVWALATATIFVISVFNLARPSAFLYFQF